MQKIATRSIQKNKKSPAVFNRKIITQYGEEIERKVFADNPESVPNFITLPNGTPRCSPINLDQTVSIFRAKNMHMHDTLGHKFMPIVPVKDKTNTSDRKNLSDRKNSIRISYMPYRASDKHMNGNYTAHKKTTC